MANLQIKIDDRQVRRYLQRFPDQVDYAMSRVLNDTAFDVRHHIVRRVWPKSVGVKARGFAGRAFRVLKARKQRLLAAVYADPLRVAPEGIEAIKRVEEGIRHYPFRGRYLAVPTKNALTPTGRIKKVAREALNETNRETFVTDRVGRGPAIWRRNKNGTLQMLFVLKPNVPTPRVFPFGREADRRARSVWQGKIRKAVIRAVKTARR